MSNNVEEEFTIKWDEEDEKQEDEDDQIEMKISDKKATDVNEMEEDKNENKDAVLDIMAQQLKFVACLKIVMEELSTLATGFEVDGGQLRYQLYVWLEREVDALRQLCNYSSGDPDYNVAGKYIYL